MGEFSLEHGGDFDGKKRRNGIRLMVEPEVFGPRFFLDQERKQRFNIPKFSEMGQQSSGKSRREKQDFVHDRESN